MPTLPSPAGPIDDPGVDELLRRRRWLRRDPFDGLLADGVPLRTLAREHGTPCWVMSAAVLRDQVRALRDALEAALQDTGERVRVHYAVKANDNLAVLEVLRREGVGADVVSGGELERALRAGIAADAVIFSGVGKTGNELRAAVERGIGQINVESHEELEELDAIARAAGRRARVAVRVNPEVEVDTIDKIATGRSGDKFGVSIGSAAALYRRAVGMGGIVPVGLAVHVGSQVGGGFAAGYNRVATLVRELRAAGLAVDAVDCGGGLAIPYRGDEPAAGPELMAGAIRRAFGGMGLTLAVEPGRWIAGPAGLLLARTIRVKRGGERTPFLVLDASMGELIRPALYGAWHGIVPVEAAVARRPAEAVDVVGPVCESSDLFARERKLPVGDAGSLYAILDAGAYGAVMSSRYNARPLAAQVMVDDGRRGLIRERDPMEALWERERVPDWLAS